jgi:hypothetical protein
MNTKTPFATLNIYEYQNLEEEPKQTALSIIRESRGFQSYCQNHAEMIQQELTDSWKCLNVLLSNSLTYDGNPDKIESSNTKRKMAWVENNIFGKYRYSQKDIAEIRKKNKTYLTKFPKNIWYSIGQRKDCPFTGVCYDEELISEFVDYFIGLGKYKGQNNSFSEAEYHIKQYYKDYLVYEAENFLEDSYIEEYIMLNELKFTEQGNPVTY